MARNPNTTRRAAPEPEIEMPTVDQVELFITTYLPTKLGSSLCNLLSEMIALNNATGDTGDTGNDDETGGLLGNEDEGEPEPAPARRRGGRAAPAQAQEEDDGGLLGDDDLLSDDEAGDDEAGDEGDDGGLLGNDDEEGEPEPAPTRRGPGKAGAGKAAPAPKVVKATWKGLGLDVATLKQYAKDYNNDYKVAEIKSDISSHAGVTLSGNDKRELAQTAAYVYLAFDTLTAMEFGELEDLLTKHGLEPEFGRNKSDKAKAAIAARAIIEACME